MVGVPVITPPFTFIQTSCWGEGGGLDIGMRASKARHPNIGILVHRSKKEIAVISLNFAMIAD
jgi:hypothetical protein